jgi:DNA-binding HxlR family transcriptional regulator
LEITVTAIDAHSHDEMRCRARPVLDLVADKWSLYVVVYLGSGPLRFTQMKRGIDGISQRMLTVTLRGLQRDGILTRTAYDVMPPHVSYELTELGRGLLQAAESLIDWGCEHYDEIDRTRAGYDEGLNDPQVVSR